MRASLWPRNSLEIERAGDTAAVGICVFNRADGQLSPERFTFCFAVGDNWLTATTGDSEVEY